MLEIKLLRESPLEVAAKLKCRGFEFPIETFNALEAQRKTLQVETQTLQSERNANAKAIGKAKSQGQPVEALLAAVSDLASKLKQKQEQLQQVQEALAKVLLEVPNLAHASVPEGRDESQNEQVRLWGDLPNFEFTPLEHFEIGERLDHGLDFAAGATLSGSRFVVLRHQLARLHRALAQFMLDTHVTAHGYTEIYVPFMVKSEAMQGTGQFPKFVEDQFGIIDSDLWLIPTGEVPLTNLVRDKILQPDALPLKWVCHSPCFRREAGSYGRDTKGMLRQHQFEKIEMVQVVHPDRSYQALEEMTQHAETIMQQLALPYRVMALCQGDLGFSASKTYDIEAWLPGQKCYREISSCSNTESFQARRLHARLKQPNQKELIPVHTLNGSGVAVGRALIAIIENYQQANGAIAIPDVLRPYMGGLERIEPST